MTALRERMIEDMKLAGHTATTRQSYLRAVTRLSKHCGNRAPDELSEEEVRRYLLWVRERSARGTIQVSHYGIRFLYQNTLGVDWVLFKKRSDFPSRSGCRSRFPMARYSVFSRPSATPFTAAVSA